MRYRRMFEMTGLPGWLRLGFSPGWQGRSATGLGPCAEYFLAGKWPTPQMPQIFQGTATREASLSVLKAQAEALKTQLEVINQRIEELQKD